MKTWPVREVSSNVRADGLHDEGDFMEDYDCCPAYVLCHGK